jgi:hypothetical protein
MITIEGSIAIYIRDQLALQAKKSYPSQSLDVILRYPSLNRLVVPSRVSSGLELAFGESFSRDTRGYGIDISTRACLP